MQITVDDCVLTLPSYNTDNWQDFVDLVSFHYCLGRNLILQQRDWQGTRVSGSFHFTFSLDKLSKFISLV